jgi:hypothetical protein
MYSLVAVFLLFRAAVKPTLSRTTATPLATTMVARAVIHSIQRTPIVALK